MNCRLIKNLPKDHPRIIKLSAPFYRGEAAAREYGLQTMFHAVLIYYIHPDTGWARVYKVFKDCPIRPQHQEPVSPEVFSVTLRETVKYLKSIESK